MENFNTSKHEYKSLVLDNKGRVKEVYRVLDGPHGTTTQISEEGDIVIRRYMRTNDVVVIGAGILNKQQVLDMLPRDLHAWLLNNDRKKIIKGPWWDGKVESTQSYQRYARRILSLLRGISRPDIFDRVMQSKHIRSSHFPTWSKPEALPEVLDGKAGTETFYVILYPDTTVTVLEFNDESNICAEDEKPIKLSDIQSKDLQIHNITKIQISKNKDVRISLHAKKQISE